MNGKEFVQVYKNIFEYRIRGIILVGVDMVCRLE